jgi:hypothetical protein
MIAQQWRDMDKSEREPWNKKADDDKKRYAREMREYAKTVEAQQANQKDKASDPPSPSDLDSLTIATVNILLWKKWMTTKRSTKI